MSKAGPGAGSLNKIQALVDELSETRVVDIVEIPPAYIAEPVAQIRVKAAGAPGLALAETQRGAGMATETLGAPVDIRLGIRRRRMHREFEERPVPKEVLAEMAWATSRAQQARRGIRNIVIVDDPDVMTVARLVLPGFTANNAPAMLVLCTNLTRAHEVLADGERSWIDTGAACAHLALYAQTLDSASAPSPVGAPPSSGSYSDFLITSDPTSP